MVSSVAGGERCLNLSVRFLSFSVNNQTHWGWSWSVRLGPPSAGYALHDFFHACYLSCQVSVGVRQGVCCCLQEGAHAPTRTVSAATLFLHGVERCKEWHFQVVWDRVAAGAFCTAALQGADYTWVYLHACMQDGVLHGGVRVLCSPTMQTHIMLDALKPPQVLLPLGALCLVYHSRACFGG